MVVPLWRCRLHLLLRRLSSISFTLSATQSSASRGTMAWAADGTAASQTTDVQLLDGLECEERQQPRRWRRHADRSGAPTATEQRVRPDQPLARKPSAKSSENKPMGPLTSRARQLPSTSNRSNNASLHNSRRASTASQPVNSGRNSREPLSWPPDVDERLRALQHEQQQQLEPLEQ